MKIIRNKIFETNSSSTHSITVDKIEYSAYGDNTEKELEKKKTVIYDCLDSYTTFKKSITIEGGEYGWGYEKLESPMEKLSYLATAVVYVSEENERVSNTELLKSFIKRFTDITHVNIDVDLDMCYIDHQSCDLARMMIVWLKNGDERLEKLIFNDDCFILISSDG